MYKIYTAIAFKYGKAVMVEVLVNERTWTIRHFAALEQEKLDERISQWIKGYKENTVFQRPYLKDIEQFKKDVHATRYTKI